MNYAKTLTIIATAVSCLFLSCKHSKNAELAVPKDASAIVHFNGATITAKANWSNLLQTIWTMDEKEMNSADKQLIEHPESSGIDLKNDFVYFTRQQGFSNYTALEGKLKESSAFEKLMQQKHTTKKVEEGNGFRYLQTGDAAFISWSNAKFIYIISQYSPTQSFGRKNNKTSISTDSLRKYLDDLYHLESSNSIETNERFTALLKEPGDIHYWVNSTQAISAFNPGPFSLLGASPFLQGYTTAGAISFENGKVVSKAKQYLSAALSQIAEKYNTQPVNAEMLKHVSPDASVVVAVNYSPQALEEILRTSGAEAFANNYLQGLHFRVQDFIQATKGQLLITISGIGAKKPTPKTMDEGLPAFQGSYLVALATNNDTSLNYLTNLIQQQLPVFTSKTANNWFVVGSSADAIDQFFATNNNHPLGDKIGGHPVGIYLNLQKAMQSLNHNEGKDSAVLRQAELSEKFWQDAVITGGEYKDGFIGFETTVNLMDKSTNSLQQLVNYAIQMMKARKQGEMAESNLFIFPNRILKQASLMD